MTAPPIISHAAVRPPRAAGAPRLGWPTAAVVVVAVGLVAAVAYYVSEPLAGILYAAGVVAVTVVRPDVTLFLVLAEAPVVHDLGGLPVKLAAADLTMVVAAPVLVVRFAMASRPLSRNPMFWPTVIYFAVCVASTLPNGGLTAEAVTSMVQMALYLLLAVYTYANALARPAAVVPALYGLLGTNLVIAAVMLVASNKGYALGMHKNAIGAELSFAVTVAAELWLARAAAGRPRRVLSVVLLLLVGGLIQSLSRGAWLGTLTGVGVLLVYRGRVGLAARGLLLVAPVAAVCWALLPASAREYATNFSHDAGNIQARYLTFYYGWQLVLDRPILGYGVGFRKLYDATNLVIATLIETGALGLLTFAGVFAAFGWMAVRARRRLPPGDPAFSLVAIGTALMAGKLAHGMVDHYWSRVMLPVWAGAGLAVWGYNLSLARRGPAAVVRRHRAGRPA